MIGILLVLVPSIGLGPESRTASEWFQFGLDHRDRPAVRIEAFRAAADAFDGRTPASALAKARSLFLAGQTPRAIAAIHAGLALAPHDRELRLDLETIRDSIRYPVPADPRLRVRPDPPAFRFSPWLLFGAATGFGALAAAGCAARLTTRPNWSPVAMAVGLAGFIVVAGLANRSGPDMPTILIREAVLRKGNGDSYAARIAEPLPAGAEVRVLLGRGGWVKVELPGGATGWLPESALLR